MQQKSTSFLGKRINYYTQGQGEKTLVLLHGFLESSKMWGEYAHRWEKEYFLIAIDIPGHGHSETVAEVHSTGLMSDVVDAVLKAEKKSRAAFVGHSMGGYIALAFGERYGEKMAGVILLNSTAMADTEIKKADRDRAIKVIQKNPVIFINEAIPNLFADQNRYKFKDEIDRIIHEALQTSVEGASSSLRGMKVREEKTHLLQSGKFPVHFIVGGKDNVIPLEKVMEQAALHPDIRTIVFPESGHMSFLEEKEACFDAMQELAKSFKY